MDRQPSPYSLKAGFLSYPFRTQQLRKADSCWGWATGRPYLTHCIAPGKKAFCNDLHVRHRTNWLDFHAHITAKVIAYTTTSLEWERLNLIGQLSGTSLGLPCLL